MSQRPGPLGPRHYRSVFLSDLHIGAKSFDAPALVKFLRATTCDHLFLVGDIIDGWKLKKRWHWTQSYSEVLDELARMADQGTQITYLPGNHDDKVRRIGLWRRKRFERAMNLRITNKAIHAMADGRHFLILHGDQFDRGILKGRISKWSDELYDALTGLIGRHQPPQITIDGQLKPFSLAKFLHANGARTLQILNNLESAVYKMARRKHVDGIICGHTHIPIIKQIKNITYANAGSWLRTDHTALIESADGSLELIHWPATQKTSADEQESMFDHPDQTRAPMPAADPHLYRPTTETLIRAIKKLFSPTETKEQSSKNITAPSLSSAE